MLRIEGFGSDSVCGTYIVVVNALAVSPAALGPPVAPAASLHLRAQYSHFFLGEMKLKVKN
jgi:hypothetical protein